MIDKLQIKNLELFNQFPDSYNDYRFSPPHQLVKILTQRAGNKYPNLVVDLGSGTGLSTRIWANSAKNVIGIEPNDYMRNLAIERTSYPNIFFSYGFGNQTHLENKSVDILQAVQSFQYMEPVSTLKEINRILRSGGIFAIVHCAWPLTITKEIKEIEMKMFDFIKSLINQNHIAFRVYRTWNKKTHFEQIKSCNYFNNLEITSIQHTIRGDFARYLGIFNSHRHIIKLHNIGVDFSNTLIELGMKEIRTIMADKEWDFQIDYQILTGIRI